MEINAHVNHEIEIEIDERPTEHVSENAEAFPPETIPKFNEISIGAAVESDEIDRRQGRYDLEVMADDNDNTSSTASASDDYNKSKKSSKENSNVTRARAKSHSYNAVRVAIFNNSDFIFKNEIL